MATLFPAIRRSTLNALLQAQQLHYLYDDHRAVDGVDLNICEGSCFGLLGPNGAGKSTTLSMLEGVLTPSRGQVLFRGFPLDNRYKQSIGIQFQSTALPDYLSVRDCLKLFASFYPRKARIADLIELCQLQEVADKLHFHLSGGQRQRLLLAMSLVNDPELLFLDEPTTGLDPQARLKFWQLVRTLKEQGKTLVLTTHYMDEAQQLCDRIAIMERGRIVAEEAPAVLLEDHFRPHLITLLDSGQAAVPQDDRYPLWRQGDQLVLECDDTQDALNWLSHHNLPLQGLTVRAPNLDDLYLKLTGSQLQP
ncbi:ABC transporter ATP-binding protein [Ferrimonas sp. YFM]|nr:ABC transporter ATP-binding protein [Ferrimonas sp. YFM]